jgi:hypothetical protein
LISAEDQLPGFSANWTSNLSSGDYPMSREQDKTYSGVIGPKISTKTTVGTIEVSSALRRTENITKQTQVWISFKRWNQSCYELSQTISKQIVAKIFEMGELNRTTGAPVRSGSGLTLQTIFDLDTSYANGTLGGETTHAVQRKLITKIAHASNYIATEGRVGPAQYLLQTVVLVLHFKISLVTQLTR